MDQSAGWSPEQIADGNNLTHGALDVTIQPLEYHHPSSQPLLDRFLRLDEATDLALQMSP